ncbi:hypothetical protein [Paludisphaera rhizosphaerae]|uniref:hypothetical protein n=1 Tax=Paludisphaera rhizosphaerae TaxID=2711216 RepID=UPI0013EB5EBD|nr:hypothetical protein [Paludisphaera rhizosphaerae]
MAVLEKLRVAPNSSGARNAPFIDLESAISKTRILYEKARRSPIHMPTAASFLGYSEKGSSFTQTVAALKKYGLINDEGGGDGRRIRISDDGHKIVADTLERSPERDKKIRHAALLPKSHAMLWGEFGAEVLDQTILQNHLRLNEDYTDEAARNAVRVYLSTILFARLDQQGILGDVSADEADRDAAAADATSAARTPMNGQYISPGTTAPIAGDSRPLTLNVPLSSLAEIVAIQLPRKKITKADYDILMQTLKLWETSIVDPEA